ncbi:MAG: hypothetical protein KDK41_17580 [Leptospiraceae bacterium]|nr:hypothetical protein [Leptospiraceae bacterium]
MNYLHTLLFILILTVFNLSRVYATCGLEYCPLASHIYMQNDEEPPEWYISENLVYSDFPSGNTDRKFGVAQTRVEYAGIEQMSVGFMVPLIVLETVSGNEFDMGNPIAFAEYRFIQKTNMIISFGTQLLLPVGSTDSGLASHHSEVMPFLSFLYSGEQWYGFSNVGFLAPLGHAHDHSVTTSVNSITLTPNAHSSGEIVFRAGGGYLLSQNFRFEIFTLGQIVTAHDHSTNNETWFQTAGLGLRWLVNPSLEIHPTFLLPVTIAKRINYQAAISTMIRI